MWERNVRRKNWKPTTNSVLCSKHFEACDFEPAAEFRMKNELKRTAVPTLFDYPDHLLPKKVKLRKPPAKRALSEKVTPKQARINHEVFLKAAISHDHSYGCPGEEVLLDKLGSSQKEIANLKEKLASERKKSFYLQKKNQNLSSMLQTLKAEGLLDSTGADHLQSLMTPTLVEIFKRLQNSQDKTSTERYPPEIRVFASTLQFYSTKAYEFVRKTFQKALPHVSTIQKWFSNVDGSPGFSSPAFELLQQKVSEGKEKNKPVLVALMLDEMSLKRQIEYDSASSSFIGFSNIGAGVSENEPKPATEALVFMVVGVNWHFKLPIGYFFITGNE